MNGRRHTFSAGCTDTGCVRQVLDVDLEVILQVLAHARQVVHDRHAERLELARVADARELQQLRRVDRAAAEDHLVRADHLRLAAVDDLDTDRARSLEDDPVDEGAAANLEVRAIRRPDAGRRAPR